jgi:DNA polymerase III delta prime subunit
MSNNPIWVEKYRPSKIEDCILPERIKSQFAEFVEKGDLPNLLLSGSAGVGKTTIAKAILKSIDADYMIINGSMKGNIDTLRNDIMTFASSMSLEGKRKFVILDEADYLTAQTQAALRNFMEEFSHNCGFILTCNYPKKIIEALHSRCAVIRFSIEQADLPALCTQFLKRLENILTLENVKFSKKVVASIVIDYAPDWRRVINEIQRNSISGVIDETTFAGTKQVNLENLIAAMKKKDFDGVRKWCSENADLSSDDIFRSIYDNCYEIVDKKMVPQLVLILADYQHKAAFVADAEINTAACLVEIISSCLA